MDARWYSPSPILNAVYSIDWGQQLAGLPKISEHPMVSSLVAASQRILGKPKSKKEPISPEMLKALVKSKISDKSPSLSDPRTVALCLVGYAGFFPFQRVVCLKVTPDLRRCPRGKKSYALHFKGKHGKLYIVGKRNKCRFREKI